MPNITIPDAMTTIIPLLITLLSHYLRSDKLSSFANASIAVAAIIIIAIASAVLSNSWSSDWRAQTLIVLAIVAFLANNEFKAVLDWLLSLDGPLAPATPTPPISVGGVPTVPLGPPATIQK